MAHTEQLKAAVMAALLAGASAHAVARRFGLSRTTVRRWRDEVQTAVQNGPQKKELGEQLLGYIGESLETQRRQLHAMCNQEWLLRQPAGELAMLYGVVFDQTVRLLVALPGEARDG